MSWVQSRACIGVDPAVFFPEVGGSAQTAKAICAGCPVKRECLDYALENREDFGVWGGLVPRERMALRKPPRRPPVAACGTNAGYYRHLRQTLTEPCASCCEAHALSERLRRHRLEVVR